MHKELLGFTAKNWKKNLSILFLILKCCLSPDFAPDVLMPYSSLLSIYFPFCIHQIPPTPIEIATEEEVSATSFSFSAYCISHNINNSDFYTLQLVNEFLQAPPRPQHTFDMGQLLEEMQQIDQQSYRQAPQRGALHHWWGRLNYACQNIPILSSTYLCGIAPDVAALALSGDWAAEFLSGPDSASAPGLTSLGDAADADWTKEFIAEAAGSFSLL